MFRAPRQLPSLETLFDDLPTRCLRTIAKHLGLAASTVQRYRQAEQAPRAVELALFWETRWGQSTIDCEVFNRDAMQRGHIDALERENAHLEAKVRALMDQLRNSERGAANDPYWIVDAPLLRGMPGCERAPTPRPIARAASGVGLVAVAAAGARVAGDPGAQLGQLRQDERGHDGPADEDQALA